MDNVKIIYNKLKKIDKNLYIVGGFSREKILWSKNKGDIDLVTDATPDEMNQVLKIVWEVGKKYGTSIVSQWSETFEITTFRRDIGSINYRRPAKVEFTDSLQEDAQRRDFTCNAIYLNLETGEFIDPTWGIEDIQNKIIRFVWNIDDRIQEDALRILRCIRFKNRYWFVVADENYWDIFYQNIGVLKNIPVERIRQELDKILLHSSNAQAFADLKKIGFLKLFFPELECLDEYPWNKYHLEWDVWEHTKMCLEEMNIIVERENIVWKRKLILFWAMLFHDIWKAFTFTIWEDWKPHYYDHENIWAEVFKDTLVDRLKFSNDFKKKIHFMIKNHLRVLKIPTMKKIKARKLMMHEYFDDLLILWEAVNKWRKSQELASFNEVFDMYANFKNILLTKTFLTGDDLMEKYPYLVGKEIWERLQQLNDQILVSD